MSNFVYDWLLLDQLLVGKKSISIFLTLPSCSLIRFIYSFISYLIVKYSFKCPEAVTIVAFFLYAWSAHWLQAEAEIRSVLLGFKFEEEFAIQIFFLFFKWFEMRLKMMRLPALLVASFCIIEKRKR